MYVHVYLVYIYILQSENKPDPLRVPLKKCNSNVLDMYTCS